MRQDYIQVLGGENNMKCLGRARMAVSDVSHVQRRHKAAQSGRLEVGGWVGVATPLGAHEISHQPQPCSD